MEVEAVKYGRNVYKGSVVFEAEIAGRRETEGRVMREDFVPCLMIAEPGLEDPQRGQEEGGS